MNKFHWKPSEFVDLPIREKALVIAMIRERIEEEKKDSKKVKRKGGKR